MADLQTEAKTAKKRGGRSARRRSREFALQGIYQWLLTNNDPDKIDLEIYQMEEFPESDSDFYRSLFHGAVENFTALEEVYKKHLDREPANLSPVERAILLIGTYELSHTVTPYRVIINEGVELAKSFGGTDGFRYVNGVLDKLVPELRPHEAR